MGQAGVVSEPSLEKLEQRVEDLCFVQRQWASGSSGAGGGVGFTASSSAGSSGGSTGG